MAGEADAVLRRIGRFAQGWIDSFSPPDSMRQIIGQLRHYTREARGTDAPIEIARQFYISLAETREAAQANLAASLPNAKPTPATRRREGAEAMLIGTWGRHNITCAYPQIRTNDAHRESAALIFARLRATIAKRAAYWQKGHPLECPSVSEQPGE